MAAEGKWSCGVGRASRHVRCSIIRWMMDGRGSGGFGGFGGGLRGLGGFERCFTL